MLGFAYTGKSISGDSTVPVNPGFEPELILSDSINAVKNFALAIPLVLPPFSLAKKLDNMLPIANFENSIKLGLVAGAIIGLFVQPPTELVNYVKSFLPY